MGCSISSSSRRVQARTQKPSRKGERSGSESDEPKHKHNHHLYVPSSDVKNVYSVLTSEVRSIKCPNGMVPIVCFHEDSFPLCAASMSLGDDKLAEIQLPCAAFSVVNGARIACVAHFLEMTSAYYESEDTSRFMRNIYAWLSPQGLPSPILLFDFPQYTHREIKSCLRSNQFPFKFENDYNICFSDYSFVIVSSDYDAVNTEKKMKLKDYVDNGGGLLVVQVPLPPYLDNDDEVRINPFLREYGLAYTYCNLLSVQSNRISVDVFSNFEKIKFCHFYMLCYKFLEMSHHKEIQTAELDDIVTALRYNFIVADSSLSDKLIDIINHAYTHLKKTNFICQDGICPNINHSILLLLINEIFMKLPPEKLNVTVEIDNFPGATGDVKLGDHIVELRLHQNTWTDTGLWLPAGHHSKILCKNPPKDMRIQIGSHAMNLLSKQGPWKRWPNIIMTFPLHEGQNEVVSPFGGIVYLLVNDLDENFSNPYEITFNGFTKHPRYVFNKPEVYESTKTDQVPWAELSTSKAIFTLPSKTLNEIEDKSGFCQRIDKIIVMVLKFLCYSMYRPYRIVFDIETIKGQGDYEYPIVLPINLMNDIVVDYMKPTEGMFQLISLISLVSLRENYFEELTEHAIAALSATVIFRELFPGFDPMLTPFDKPVLFPELWFIHSHLNSIIIPQLLHESQDENAILCNSPEDMWVRFIKDLSFRGKFNFAKLLENIKPIPMNISAALSELPAVPSRSS